MRIPYQQLKAEFERVLTGLNINNTIAGAIATVFADNSRDGVHSHGLNRFPTFIEYIKEGLVFPDAVPTKVNAFGAIEQWDGNLAPGMLNARFCMDRAISLANDNGIGCVAIKNTNHWMRGGTYGQQAADAGYIGLCFTNTIANLPPWGGTEPRLGNNPLIIAIPREGGNVVLDMAVSQYAFGKLWQYEAQNKPLPVPGGYDTEGNLTTDAAAIVESKRALPIGFWKGSGLSLVLDLLATILSGGDSTAVITQSGRKETGVSQVFIAIKTDNERNASLIEQIIDYTKSSESDTEILFPGENMLRTREQSLKEGVWVDEQAWAKVKGL
ncbi:MULTISPECIES: 3-dehydro-L-gulonate 2-dehydrogenase [unclassified Mucilaginibacter]|uniref:3-dehydro-L-gulonate 2-dehydrogenase n=1 Tax=unclassified Mucilaginibacter TaxID=2617802 RepID=UPI002AC9228A|nr:MULTISPECIES: 3-dehydro-L-gulonate 2-dehydrogenase [unclassified Mucilaginibacter]MEB0248697.1 3-dehydro-L-gulonate 2-dehydrogenase [Mucilaginibacter sp. 5B2]MEB0261331.1 3-dehydro-L-gulonate 2-dehydrogenase [Mucilaginibacter sp. 10I4]MEB0280406.1 3-dehydro-L-gulonate 2-dehydrogenase [Mucilaginibacter sp. 10B2]MEB0300484.1 3-dehydro-L-gulonate 2-dehydrogenase [Mucilaginibacter sp. 5C4]WPX23082.1 3-dehydro-L-gulonate 2-dehydrogenase [Mucilaginibacter sp. 5C4]